MTRRTDSGLMGVLLTVGALLALGAGGYLVYSGLISGDSKTSGTEAGQKAAVSPEKPGEVRKQLQNQVDLTQKKASVQSELLTSGGQHISRADFNRAWESIPKSERAELSEAELADEIRERVSSR